MQCKLGWILWLDFREKQSCWNQPLSKERLCPGLVETASKESWTSGYRTNLEVIRIPQPFLPTMLTFTFWICISSTEYSTYYITWSQYRKSISLNYRQNFHIHWQINKCKIKDIQYLHNLPLICRPLKDASFPLTNGKKIQIFCKSTLAS